MNKAWDRAKEIVAKKHNLGNTLVTGHKAEYWAEAAQEYADILNTALQHENTHLRELAEFFRNQYDSIKNKQ